MGNLIRATVISHFRFTTLFGLLLCTTFGWAVEASDTFELQVMNQSIYLAQNDGASPGTATDFSSSEPENQATEKNNASSEKSAKGSGSKASASSSESDGFDDFSDSSQSDAEAIKRKKLEARKKLLAKKRAARRAKLKRWLKAKKKKWKKQWREEWENESSQSKMKVEPPAKKAPDYSHSVTPKAFTFLRAAQTDGINEFGQIQYGIHGPAGSYLFGSLLFNSATDDIEPNYDFATFGAAQHLFTPHYGGLGLVGQHFASSAADSTQYRSGFYYTTSGKIGAMRYLLIPFFLFNDVRSDAGRHTLFYLFNFYKGLIILDGTVAYTHNQNFWGRTANPAIGVRVGGSCRAVFGVEHARTKLGTRDDLFSGFEFRAYY
ncbi:MAG: hypothetical protein HRT45_16550 [Bdellovibrionales bacterium]|nr:hypothetical protein [Bdellovibrionales bacterium]